MEKYGEMALQDALAGETPGSAPGRAGREHHICGMVLRCDGAQQDVGAAASARRMCEVLFIEADRERNGTRLPRLVCLYEGRQGDTLIHPYYFAAEAAVAAEALWQAVWRYIRHQYEPTCLQRIFLYGDGAPWVRAGTSILPKSVFVLHPFYLRQWLTPALVLQEDDFGRAVWSSIEAGDQIGIERLLREAEARAPNLAFRQAIRNCRRSMRKQWDGIAAYHLFPEARQGTGV